MKSYGTYYWQRINYLLILFSVFFGSFLTTITVSGQNKKVKIFLMAGQSNMQGHGNIDALKRILCAKGDIELPNDPQGCYREETGVEERLFQTISSFYWNGSAYAYGYQAWQARLEAILVARHDLADERLLEPFQDVQMINFNYSRSDGVRSAPGTWSGPLTTGFGFSSRNGSYGPELVFGHRLAEHMADDIVLIKVAEGGTDLYEMWRSPSMEARLGISDEPTNYPLLVQHLNEVRADISSYLPKYVGVEVEIEVAGFVWFQGWNDAMKTTYASAYEENLFDLVTDLRNDLNLPGLPIVIGQTQNDSQDGMVIQEAQRTVASTIENAGTFITTDLSGYFHFDASSHLIIGDRMASAMLELYNIPTLEPLPIFPSPIAISSSGPNAPRVTLQWEVPPFYSTGLKIMRSVNSEDNFEEIATLSLNDTEYTDSDLLPASTHYYQLISYNDFGDSHSSEIVSYQTGEQLSILPSTWATVDIGDPGPLGSGVYENGTFTLQGAGAGINGRSDQFYYVHQGPWGNGEIIAKIDHSIGSGNEALAGIMIRRNLGASSPQVSVLVDTDGQAVYKSRGHTSGTTVNANGLGTANWLRLVKEGSKITAYSSDDGANWQLVREKSFSNLGPDCYYGLAVTSNDPAVLASAVFSEVVINIENQPIPAAPSDLIATAVSAEGITLSWTDNSDNETGFRLERSLDENAGFEEIATLSAGITTYQDTVLEPSTTYYYRILAYNEVGGVSDYSETTSVTTETLPVFAIPSPWEQVNIGEPDLMGSGAYEDGTYTISGSGAGINGRSDQFYYVHQGPWGNGEIITKVDHSVGSGNGTLAGVMIRRNLGAGSPQVSILVDANRQAVYRSRGHASGTTVNANGTGTANWLRLVKNGSTITAYSSDDGTNWQLVREKSFSNLGPDCYYGLAVTGNDPLVLASAVFSGVVVNTENEPIPMAPSDLVATAVSSEGVTLSWTDNSDNETGFKLERSTGLGNDYEEIATLNADIISYQDMGLQPATRYYYRLKAYNDSGDSDYSNSVNVQTNTPSTGLPAPWVQGGVGEEDVNGSASYADGTFTIASDGKAINGRSDEFYYVYQGPYTDGEVIAKIELSPGLGSLCQAGIMIRQGITPASPHIAILMSNDSTITVKSRGHNGGSTVNHIVPQDSARWVKLAREANKVSAYISVNGADWQLTREMNFNTGNYYYGLVVTSNNSTVTSSAKFSEVVVTGLGSIPPAPTGLSTSTVSSTGIVLSWTDNSENETGFKIERSLMESAGFEEIAILGANVTSYEDTNLTPNTTYYYRVRSYNGSGSSGFDQIQDQALPLAPLLPTGLQATAFSASGIQLSWVDNSENETGFRIERSLDMDSGFVEIGVLNANTNSYQDDELDPSTYYYYRVRAYNPGGISNYSEVAGTQTKAVSTELPSPWQTVDVGEPLVEGAAGYDNGSFFVWGAGNEVEKRKDEFHFVYQPLPRNGEIIAKVNQLTQEGRESKAGLMVRESLSGTRTRMFFVSYSTNVNADFIARSRDSKSGGTHGGGRNANVSLPLWLKLVKDGEYFSAHYGTDGVNWTMIYDRIVPLDDEVYAGLMVNSNNDSSASRAVFSDVAIHPIATPATPRELTAEVNDINTIVTLAWQDYAKGEHGFVIERSTSPNEGFEAIDTVAADTESYQDMEAPLTTCYYRTRSYDLHGFSAYSNVDDVYVGTIPGPWVSVGIGHSASPDTVTFREGLFSIHESGTGIDGTTDQFRYLYQDAFGDGEIVARLRDVTSTGNSSKVGLMIRENLEPGSKMVAFGTVDGTSGLFFQRRTNNGNNSISELIGSGEAPMWLKLARLGDVFTAYRSADGVNWTEVGQATIDFSDDIYLGMMASGGSTNGNVTGVFDEPMINRFNAGNRILNLTRKAGDYDRSGLNNIIEVQATPDTVNRRNTYTGMQGKTIVVDLASAVRSSNATVSFKFIPDSLNQSVNLLETDDIVVHLDGDRLSATIAGQVFNSDLPVSNIICNHVAMRFSRQNIGFYLNGEWQVIDNNTSFEVDRLTFSGYKGQTWDIQVYEGLPSNSEIEKISQLCVPGVDASEHSPYGEAYTKAICGSYKCLWAKEDVDLMQERFLYHLYEQDISYELFTFQAGMYIHEDLEWSLDYGNAQNWWVTDNEAFIKGSFDQPLTPSSGRHWFHENFHGYQSFNPDRDYAGGKWLFEATANWGASYRYNNVPNSGVTGVTLYPHLPMLEFGKYKVPDGNRDYHHYILFSYITRFVSTPFFIGKLYNYRYVARDPVKAINDILAGEGHDFQEVFTEYVARTTVWDYLDGSGPSWKATEAGGIQAFESQGFENFNYKFTHVMDPAGTNGAMTAIPGNLLPGVYSWNAYKIDSTTAATYSIKLKGSSDNPGGTNFKAKVIKGQEGNYEYFDLPVNAQVAFGDAIAQFELSMQAGEELYLIVASTPNEYPDLVTPRYQYEYSIEAIIPTGASRAINDNESETVEAATLFPNATHGQLKIDLPFEMEEQLEVALTNSQGRPIPLEFWREGNQVNVEFDAPEGLYFIRIRSADYNKLFRVINIKY